MTFEEILEVARQNKADYPAGELALVLNSYIQDVCNEVEPFTSVIEIYTDGDQAEIFYSDLGNTFNDTFMKPRDLRIAGERIHKLSDGLNGDIVYEMTGEGFIIGKRYDKKVLPLQAETIIEFEYYSYPEAVTLQTRQLPISQLHSMYLWKIKADIFAERREWDRAGYYNRRADRALVLYRRMVQSQGMQHMININTRI